MVMCEDTKEFMAFISISTDRLELRVLKVIHGTLSLFILGGSSVEGGDHHPHGAFNFKP